MIKVNNLNGNPEYIPETTGGIHTDENYFYFFETKQEHDNFLASLPEPEPTPQPEVIGGALQAVLAATPEELDQIKKILGIV